MEKLRRKNPFHIQEKHINMKKRIQKKFIKKKKIAKLKKALQKNKKIAKPVRIKKVIKASRVRSVVKEEVFDVFEKKNISFLNNGEVAQDIIESIRVMPLKAYAEFFVTEEVKVEPITIMKTATETEISQNKVDKNNTDNVSEEEATDMPQASKLKKIRELTLVKILQILAWPITKMYGLIYWYLKFHLIKRKKKQYIIKYLETHEKENQVVDVFARPDKVEMLGLVMPHNWKRVLVSFIVVGFFLILPFQGLDYYENISSVKEKMLRNSRIALLSLKDGQNSIKNLDLRAAAKNFENAKINFKLAKFEFSKLNIFTQILATKLPKKGKNIQASLNLLDAGKSIAEAGENLSMTIFSLLDDFKNSKNLSENTLDKLSVLRGSLDLVIPKVAQAKEEISAIDTDELNIANKNAVNAAQRTLPDIEDKLQNLSTLTDIVLNVLGYDYWQRYLVLFENSNEMRATGGFLGSYALIDVNKGKIANMEIPAGGSYDLQGSMLALVESPKPLHIVNPIWEFQDSNWWPDFPTTAKKIDWFYQKSLGPSVHGIIALTSNFMEDMLSVIGPIPMEKYQRVLTSDNFIDETQKIVELEYDKAANKPKQFIADMAPEIIEKISMLGQDKLQELLNIVYQGLKEKQILLYSFDNNIQSIIEDFDWGGVQTTNARGDYLSVINTNIAGDKTDSVIREEISHSIEVSDAGTITDTITISRTHNGIKGELFTGAQNNDYIRIYVPKGSTFVSAEGFLGPDENLYEEAPENYKIDEDLRRIEGEHKINTVSGTEIYEENNKTVFANWILLKPGEAKTATIVYTLPFTLSAPNSLYNLTVQKQPGSIGTKYNFKFFASQPREILETYPKDLDASTANESETVMQYSDTLTVDKFYGIVLK